MAKIVIDLSKVADLLSDDLKNNIHKHSDFDGWSSELLDILENEYQFESRLREEVLYEKEE